MCTPAAPATTGFLGSWVEQRTEPVRGGGVLIQLVNRRDRVAFSLTADEAALLATNPAGLPQELLDELHAAGFSATSEGLPPPSLRKQAVSAVVDLTIRFTRGDALVQWLYRTIARHLFTPVAVAAQAALALIGVLAVGYWLIAAPDVHYRVSAGQLPLVLGLSTLAIALHELGHALVLAHYGRRVDAIGAGLHLGSPVCFVEAVEGLLLDRRPRLIQAAAGVWVEWQVTALAALALLIVPTGSSAEVLHRFVLINTFVIASNLLPFVGLDGYLLFSDLIRVPDLAQRSTGAIDRALAKLLAHQPLTRADHLLAGYRLANGVVAAALLAMAGVLWATLFGPSIAELIAAGPLGWVALALLTALLGRPALRASGPKLIGFVRSGVEFTARLRFRLEWAWRVPATEILSRTPAFADADERELGVVAGRLTCLAAQVGLSIGEFGAVLRRGTITVQVADGDQLTIRQREAIPAGAAVITRSPLARVVLVPDARPVVTA